jgi:hypothetical protein
VLLLLLLRRCFIVVATTGELLQQVGDLPRRSNGEYTTSSLLKLQATQASAAAAAVLESAVQASAAVDLQQARNPQLTALLNVKRIIDTKGLLRWTGTDFCFWTHIKCNGANEVISINIWAGTGMTNLTGKLPNASVLRPLPKLVNITIGDNRGISGPIPDDWNTLVNLEDLRLGNNRLNGELPPTLNALTQLRTLYLYTNRFTGKIPTTWSTLTALTDLQMSGNLVSGSLPPSWKSMTNLKMLMLHDNPNVIGALPNWGAMTQLVELTAYNMKLDRQLPSGLRGMRSLETLMVYKNRLPGTFPSSWISLRNMNYLDVSQNSLQGTIPPSYGPTWQLLGQGDDGGFFVDRNPLLTGCMPKEWQPNLPDIKYDILGTQISGFCQ